MSIAIRLTLCAGVLMAGCGDDSKECGEGTVDEGGRCVVEVVPPVTCAEGTLFDAPTNTCVVDPATCRAGTVFVRGTCQDPTADLSPDLEEGAEPNGLGINDEVSAAPAGVITMPAIGSAGVVLHGRIDPQPDRDGDGVPEGDFDTYVLDATGPAVLAITADGVNGLAAGYAVHSEVDGLEQWQRGSINLTGDIAQGRVFLPAAGRYRIVIGDARTFGPLTTVPDDPDAEYFVTIVQHSLTTPQAITLTGGMATQSGTIAPKKIDFWSFTLEGDRTDLVLTTGSDVTMGAFVLLIDGDLAGHAGEAKLFGTNDPAELTILGGVAGEVATIVVDPRITNTTTPVAYDLDVEAVSTLR
jgi:hypothetical protein